MEAVKIKEGVKLAMELSKEANGFFQHNQPWVLAKSEKAEDRYVSAAGFVVAVR